MLRPLAYTGRIKDSRLKKRTQPWHSLEQNICCGSVKRELHNVTATCHISINAIFVSACLLALFTMTFVLVIHDACIDCFIGRSMTKLRWVKGQEYKENCVTILKRLYYLRAKFCTHSITRNMCIRIINIFI